MNSKLPTECLINIFENFGPTHNEWDDSFKSLHACVLVNRKWCEVGLTILWREPIEWLHSKEHNRFRLVSLISTYISCLPQDSNFQILDDSLPSPDSTLKSASFTDYPSFLKGFDYQSLYNAVEFWVTKNYNPENKREKDNDVKFHQFQWLELLVKLFMTRSKHLKRFSVFMKNPVKDVLHLPLLPEAKECLSIITEFSCKGCLFPEFMYLAAQSCRNIKRFNIECCCKDNGGLAKLIEMQEVPLDCIVIHLKNKNVPLLENIIRERAHSVKDIRLKGIALSLEYFKDSKKIERMRLQPSVYNNTDHHLENFMNSSFPKLKDLTIKMNCSFSQLSTFIKNTHGSLERLEIDCMPTCVNEFPMFTETLVNSCKNLYHYYGPFHVKGIDMLHTFLQNCPNLESLSLHNVNDDDIDISDVLQQSGSVVPINLIRLQIINYIISAEALEIFLKACATRLSKTLDFMCDPESQDINSVIETFAGKG